MVWGSESRRDEPTAHVSGLETVRFKLQRYEGL